MNKSLAQILFAMVLAASPCADAALSVGDVTLYAGGGPCWTSGLIGPLWPSASTSNTFTLTGASGLGVLITGSYYVANDSGLSTGDHIVYYYDLDLSGMSASNHCVKLMIHFGRPLACTYDVLVLTNGTGTIDVSSAVLGSFGDINFTFGPGCLSPGNTATRFEMVSDTQPKHGTVTISDEWTSGGQAQLTTIKVPAIVPDIPPDWVYPLQLPGNVLPPYPLFQGNMWCNEIPMTVPTNGIYKFGLQLLDGSNGLAASTVMVQDVPVVNGLFTTPLPFFPTVFMGNPLWLSMSVMPPGGTTFTQLSPPLPLTPAPQAYYAFAAGVVADLSPGQAVTSLNGLTDDVVLTPGTDVFLETNGNRLIISASLGSDRTRKTDFEPVAPEEILARLLALPIQAWRFTNEAATVRHLGPMAQDFKTSFGLGTTDTRIGIVDEGGVALTAIQGLNRKLEAQLKAKDAELEALKLRLEKLERTVGQRNSEH